MMETRNNDKAVITGLFKNPDDAEHAYDAALSRGYTKDEINVIMTEETRKTHFNPDHNDKHEETALGNKAMEGAGTGSAIGGAIGAVAGAIAAIGTSLIIPGLGIAVAGPIAAALAGAGAGGITGGIVGALIGSGIPEDRAKDYEKAIKGGNIMLTVRPHTANDADDISDSWRNYNGDVMYK